MNQYQMPPPWRVEGKATPFHKALTLRHFDKLDDAIAALPKLKSDGRYYSVKVRAN